MKKSIVILAPHIDDELIGCFSILKKKKIDKVVYFYELSEIRKKEAIEAGKKYGFEVDFSSFALKEDIFDELYIPSCKDAHPHHRRVNSFAKTLKAKKKYYYSVDLNTEKIELLSVKKRKEKKEMLDLLYPSQKELWQKNAKYYLFESITNTEKIIFAKIKHSFSGIHCWKQAKNYLKYPHRHMFHVVLYIELFHNDRELEFIREKERLVKFCNDNFENLAGKSCEMIGQEIISYFETLYTNKKINIEVSEDNENGIFITD